MSKAALFYCIAAILVAIGVGAFWYAFSLSKGDVNPADRIPYLIGYYFWVPFLVYAGWRSALKKRKGTGVLLGSMAFVAIALYQSQSIINEAEMDRRALTKMHAMLLELMEGKVIARAQLKDAGEYGPFLLAARRYELRMKGDFKQYQAQLAAANLGVVLSPKTLASTTAIARTLAALDALKASADQTESDVLKDYDGMSRAVQSTSMPQRAREGIISGLNTGVSRGKAAFRQFFDIEHHIFVTTTDILNFMRGRQGLFVVRGNQLMFARHADLVTYNDFIAQLRAEAAQESAWRTDEHNLLAQKAEAIQQDVNSLGQ